MFQIGDVVALIDRENYNDLSSFVNEHTKSYAEKLIYYTVINVDDDGFIMELENPADINNTIEVYERMLEEHWHVWPKELLLKTFDNYKTKEYTGKYADVCRKVSQLYLKHNNKNNGGFQFNL